MYKCRPLSRQGGIVYLHVRNVRANAWQPCMQPLFPMVENRQVEPDTALSEPIHAACVHHYLQPSSLMSLICIIFIGIFHFHCKIVICNVQQLMQLSNGLNEARSMIPSELFSLNYTGKRSVTLSFVLTFNRKIRKWYPVFIIMHFIGYLYWFFFLKKYIKTTISW